MTTELFFRELTSYLAEGGFVMGPLYGAAIVLWYAVGYRFLILQRGLRGDLGRHLAAGRPLSGGIIGKAWSILTTPNRAFESGDEADAYARQALIPIRQRLGTFKVLVRTIVVLAPLAGLLGTVAGMIETFDSLGDRALFASSGGVAGGIAQALLTTQMGLIVAVPGLIAGRLLDRRQVRIEDDLEQLRELLVLKTQETLA